ncbi:MAG: ABC transporter permease [Proteobacteria bacterium]|nr:ABC transporter permease [Pseudomonadota bacterium]
MRCNSLIANIGHSSISFVRLLGKIFIFLAITAKASFTGTFYWRIFLQQLLEVWYRSLPVVGLTAIFTGAVLALQSYTGFSRLNVQNAVASIVVLSITRELGPVLAGLMLAGRLGAAIAAELGTMAVTEQLDALSTLNTNPLRYLVVPRILAGTLVMPLLVIIADIIGVFGGYLVSVYKLGFPQYSYLRNTFELLETQDVVSGLIKAAVFGFIVCVVGCFYGYNSTGGAYGVGEATTNAVVGASILILLMNYIITGLLF